jgi:hypothetical protein
MHVNVCNADGSPIPQSVYEAINNFANLFEYGRYNGQEDLYESYENSGLVTDNGTKIEAGVKYVSVDNRPSFGTVEWVKYEVSTGRTYDECGRYCDSKIIQKAMGL